MINLGQIRGIKFGRRLPAGPLREAIDAEVERRRIAMFNAAKPKQATAPALKSFWRRLIGGKS